MINIGEDINNPIIYDMFQAIVNECDKRRKRLFFEKQSHGYYVLVERMELTPDGKQYSPYSCTHRTFYDAFTAILEQVYA